MKVLAMKRAIATETREAPALPAVALGVVLGEADGGRWRVRAGGAERMLAADASVDPALLREAAASGARVVLDASGEAEAVSAGTAPVIVGVLSTHRALTIDRDGAVTAEVRRFSITVAEEALLRAADAFVRVKADDLELYGRRVISRARELCRVLGRLVKIN